MDALHYGWSCTVARNLSSRMAWTHGTKVARNLSLRMAWTHGTKVAWNLSSKIAWTHGTKVATNLSSERAWTHGTKAGVELELPHWIFFFFCFWKYLDIRMDNSFYEKSCFKNISKMEKKSCLRKSSQLIVLLLLADVTNIVCWA